MANMTFKANLLPNSNLGYSLGSSDLKWNIYGNCIGYVQLPASATDNAVVRFDGTDGEIQDSTTTIDDNGTMNIKGKLVVNPSYDTTTNSYNEGIRINQASNGWAEVVVGGTADSTSSIADGQWIIGRRGAAGSKAGAIGDFTIEEQDSTGAGLTLHKDAGGATLYSSKAVNTGCLTVKNAASITSGTTWVFNGLVPNMGTGTSSVLLVGQANSTKNQAYIGFYYSASGSNDNYLKLGMYAADNQLIIKGDGKTGIGTTAPSEKLEVNGNVKATKFIGPLNGNADSATKLATARTISLTGAVTGSGSFNGTANLSIATTVNHNHDSVYVKKAGDTMTGNLTVSKSGPAIYAQDTANNNIQAGLIVGSGHQNHGVYSNGYAPTASTFTSSGKWIIYRGSDGEAHSNLKIYGAVWNDYAEYRKDNPIEKEQQKPGRCVHEVGDGTLALTTKRLMRGCEIISDTFGFAIGQDKKRGYDTPIASSGRVLAYPYEDIEEFKTHIGYCVCSGPNGTVSIMTDEEEEKYSGRIIGTISEIPDYDIWYCGTNNEEEIKVNGRVWIRIR